MPVARGKYCVPLHEIEINGSRDQIMQVTAYTGIRDLIYIPVTCLQRYHPERFAD